MGMSRASVLFRIELPLAVPVMLAGIRTALVLLVGTAALAAFVNGGGTGSIVSTSADPSVTEIAAGSGLYSPALFDGYRSIRPIPAAFFALPVVRRPRPGIVTALGGGWIASGGTSATW